jgi:FkbM family methyltransferase
MALGEALANIRSNYRFHLGTSGSRPSRLLYLTAYYALYLGLRWGDRHKRALDVLKRLGLSDRPALVETPDGVKLDLDLHTAFDPLYSIVGQGDYELEPGFRPLPGWNVVDVGANVGVYAVTTAKRVGPQGRVIAVEPFPENAKRLRANALRNGLSGVTVVEAAAGDREGSVDLFVHERGINHSLVRGSGTAVKVSLTTVDAAAKALPKVHLLKIDVEGVVPAVLRGARETIRRDRPLLVIERDAGPEDEGVDAFLAEAGYVQRSHGPVTFASPK